MAKTSETVGQENGGGSTEGGNEKIAAPETSKVPAAAQENSSDKK